MKGTGLKEKIKALVQKHGHSVKGLLLATVIFPPAGLFIAFKNPAWTRLQKGVAMVGVVALTTFIIFFGAAIITALVTAFYKLGALVFERL
jgi:hypothetical protein